MLIAGSFRLVGSWLACRFDWFRFPKASVGGCPGNGGTVIFGELLSTNVRHSLCVLPPLILAPVEGDIKRTGRTAAVYLIRCR